MPRRFLEYFKGPSIGIEGVRDVFKICNRLIVGTVPRPKEGYTPEEVEKLAYEILSVGLDKFLYFIYIIPWIESSPRISTAFSSYTTSDFLLLNPVWV